MTERMLMKYWHGRILLLGKIMPNKFLQSDKNMLSCLLLAQKPRQHVFAAEERRYVLQ
jgi:hypothetical protein